MSRHVRMRFIYFAASSPRFLALPPPPPLLSFSVLPFSGSLGGVAPQAAGRAGGCGVSPLLLYSQGPYRTRHQPGEQR
jgi:hypothetical protein